MLGNSDTESDGRRGQAYTLEGLIAATIIVTAVWYGLQAADTSPWTAGTSDRLTEIHRSQANDVLATAADDGTLSRAVRCIEPPNEPDQPGMPHDGIGHAPAENTTRLGAMLNESFNQRDIEYNLYFVYYNNSTGRVTQHVYPDDSRRRAPSEDAVNASHQVAIYDRMNVSYGLNNCMKNDNWVENVSDVFYAPDVDPDGELYNIVEVRLVVW
jgi:hypothetical protein